MDNFTLIRNKAQISDIAEVLAESLPILHQYSGETFIIKCSGSVMDNPQLAELFAKDIVSLKKSGINVIIVHGSSIKVNSILDRLNFNTPSDNSRFANQASVEIIEMIMSGLVNKNLVTQINQAGGTAIGISGKDGNLLEAKRLRRTKSDPLSNIEQIIDFGFMGELTLVNPELLMSFEDTEIIPIISPIAIGESGETYQVNSNVVAGALSSTLAANKLIMVSDNNGIIDQQGKRISIINFTQISKIINDNKIDDEDLLDKINVCVKALEHHTENTHIIDGRIPHALILEVLTKERIGTMFRI